MKIAVCSRSFSRHPILREELNTKFSDVKFNDKGESLQGEGLINFLNGVERAIIALEKVDGEILKKLPELKVISKYGVGTDSLDFNALKAHGVSLGWKPGVNRRSVAELALFFTIGCLRQSLSALNLVKSGRWEQVIGVQLSSKVVGIIGLGNVGKEFVQLLKPFACKLQYHDLLEYKGFAEDHHIEKVSLKTLLNTSDVVSIHVPLNETTINMITKEQLCLMKESAVLVNTARGGIVNELDLYEALINGKILAAGFDVLNDEPPSIDEPLLQLENFFITPHIGGSTSEAILAMGRAAIDGLSEFKSIEEWVK